MRYGKYLLVLLIGFLRGGYPVLGQHLTEWQRYFYCSGLDTTGIGMDSASLSRVTYQLAYGWRPDRVGPWQLGERIDSVRVNQVVRLLLTGTSAWADHLRALEPVFEPYRLLRVGMDSLLATGMDSIPRLKEIRSALNQYRWLNRLSANLIVVVNIPSATLRVISRQGPDKLQSRVIVGNVSTPTPVFGAQLTRIITFPYWNVPRSIAIKELLTKIKRNPAGILDTLKMQVLDLKGQIIAPESINWQRLSAHNFPYRLRQSTGCDNALGVMKFDLNSPFDVYLHDTNHRELFDQSKRFLSHGCIRVAKPIELANLLLDAPIFTSTFLETRQVNVQPRIIPLPKAVPVVITYQTVEATPAGTFVFYSDVYDWHNIKR